jgi:hypothetical protein
MGTVFKINQSTGELTTLAEFLHPAAEGAGPQGELEYDGAGFFWGTTVGNGYNNGTVFKISASASPSPSPIVAMSGDLTQGIDNGVFSTLGNPAMNEAGHVAFGAKVKGTPKTVGIYGSNSLGIWADGTNGVRQLVVRSGTTAPDAAGTGSVGVFKKFSDPVYSGSSAVAFLGTLVQGGGVVVSNDTGVWSNDGGTLHLVAREGVQAPGCGAGVVFKTFTQIALPDQGGVVMFAKLGGTGVTSASDMAIFAVDTGGTLQLIAREGTPHAVTGKAIKTLSFLPAIAGVSGQTRGFSQSTGDLVYSATFTDGSAGIFKVVFP